MKKGVAVVAVLLFIALTLYIFVGARNPAAPAVPPDSQISSTAQTAASPKASSSPPVNPGSSSQNSIPPGSHQQPASLAASAGQAAPVADLPPETVLQNVERAVHQYGDMFGGNPVGTNPEITSQLTGNNPKSINFITAQAGMRINADGELVDAWGTPYFFHQLSGTETEIHSAGPDKIMWTADDLVVK